MMWGHKEIEEWVVEKIGYSAHKALTAITKHGDQVTIMDIWREMTTDDDDTVS